MSQHFDIKTSKRYFHMVAFKFSSKFSLKSYWKDCNSGISTNSFLNFDNQDVRIEHSRITSNVQYYFGENDYSESGTNTAPFNYDLIAIELKKHNIFIFGFPFKLLAKDIIRKLVEDKKYKTKGAFLKPSLDKLVKDTNSQDFGDDWANFYFSSLSMIITGDTNITSIDFEGDKPLESLLYKKHFRKMIEEDLSKIERGVIKCETETALPDNIPKTRANIHLDHYGNFRMYVHGTAKNLFTVPFLFKILNEYKCLQTTLTNPLINLSDEQI